MLRAGTEVDHGSVEIKLEIDEIRRELIQPGLEAAETRKDNV